MAYARRAALLADELLDWSRIYEREVRQAQDNWYQVQQLPIKHARVAELQEMGMQLQRISIGLAAMR